MLFRIEFGKAERLWLFSLSVLVDESHNDFLGFGEQFDKPESQMIMTYFRTSQIY
jgi:hypothetical protein